MFEQLIRLATSLPHDIVDYLSNLNTSNCYSAASSSLILVPIGGALLWYIFRRDDSDEQARIRGVKAAKLPNIFMVMLQGERMEQTALRAFAQQGPILGCYLLKRYTIFLAVPELVGQVLNKEFDSFPNRREFLISDPAFSENLLSSTDDQWKRLHSIIQPAFSATKIKQMKPCIDETVQLLMKNLEGNTSNNIINAKVYLGAFAMDAVIRLAFGVKIDSLVERNNPLILNAKKMFSMDLKLKDMIGLALKYLFPRLAKLFGLSFATEQASFFMQLSKKLINEKRAELKKSKNSHKANNFIEFMIETEEQSLTQGGDNHEKPTKYLTTEEITSMCTLCFLAGYETTASTITMVVYNLAIYPEIQERLYRENESIFAKLQVESIEDDPYKAINLENISAFEYLDAIVNETLRLYSPTLYTERAAVRDVHLETLDGAHKIDVKAGDIVHIPIYSIHRSKEFVQPEKFDPERFIKPLRHDKNAFIPFGAGPRQCVAKMLALLEIKLALIHAVRQFKWSTCELTKIPAEYYSRGNLYVPRDVILKIDKRWPDIDQTHKN